MPALRARWEDAPDVDALAKRVTGARGVRAAVWLRTGAETCLLLFLESVAMRDAYAVWLQAGARPPDHVEVVAAAPGRSGAAPLVELLLGPDASTTLHR